MNGLRTLLDFLALSINLLPEDIAILLREYETLTADEQAFIEARTRQLLNIDRDISDLPELGNHEIKKQLLELQFNSLRLYLMRTLPNCEDALNKIFGTITKKINLVNDVLKSGLNRQPPQIIQQPGGSNINYDKYNKYKNKYLLFKKSIY